ncbi:non-ribosomal peptide synthetase, partial [Actinophytocola sp.]|uniref:non-ribosomal peptide synthetase n=1 Tax=Actinophytocola sp. TaxID=1872138 RepID=UPI00389ADE4E
MTTTESRRQELLAHLLTGGGPKPAANPPTSRDHRIPLSTPQRQLWFLDHLRPGALEYVMPFAWRLTGPLDVAALHHALTEITTRHEILRTRYPTVAGEPTQVIDPPAPVSLREVDLSGPELSVSAGSVEPGAGGQALDMLLGEQATTPFDLSSDHPVRWVLARLNTEEHVLALTVHHIAFDGQSVAVLARELSALYTGGEPAPLPIQYADFAAWQGEQPADLTYWRERLAGLTPLELPTDRPRPAMHDPAGATVTFTVPAEHATAMRTLAKEHRATPFMAYLAAFQLLLARYTGQTDVAVGSPVAGRTRPETHDLIGYFVNTLVLRTDLTGDPPFGALLARVRQTTLDALQHQDVPFERIVDEVAPDRDPSRNPLFSTMFVLQNTDRADFTTAGLRGEALDVPWHSAKFDLTLYLTERPDGSITGVVEYATALFDRTTAHRLGDHYTELLTTLTADTRVSTAELVPATERRRLAEWNETTAHYPAGTLTELFAAQVARTPDAPALRFEGTELTYAELDRRANRLAHHLLGQGVGPESVVGVCLHRSLDLVVALLGIHKAGGAYLPLDPDYPADRLAYLKADSGAEITVTADTFADPTGPNHDPAVEVLPEHPAYVIYTSGSTGRPKGVMIEHCGIVNRLQWMQDTYALDATDRVLQKTPYTFDVSVWEFFWPLTTGAMLVLARPDGHRDPTYLAETITGEQITTLHFVPSMLRAFLTEPFDTLPSLRRVLCSGEALPADLVTAVHERIGCALHNLYGPTEASVDVTAVECHPGEPVTIGRPVANTRTHILDSTLRPVPIGVPGELMLAGIQLARGYLNKPALTADRFIPNPFTPGERLYRTGDRARFRPDGTIDYLGRLDHQVKIRGQ